ncbi:MAG: substrate-binding domain-containing protein [Candidatus Acidulodesulfobacterium sp.]
MRTTRLFKMLALSLALVFALTASMSVSSFALGIKGVYPPWCKNGDPSVHQGYIFNAKTVDNNPDYHGNITAAILHPKSSLTLYIGGNIFFVLPHLVKAFMKKYPNVKHVFYITIPPGILIRMWKHNDTITLGNLTMRVVPDVYMAGAKKLQYTNKIGMTEGPIVTYVTNDLEIMTYKGNPFHITGLKSFMNPKITLSMPNPAWEGIAKQIKASLVKAGGKKLEQAVYNYGVKSGRVFLTHIHHRQTPMRIMEKKSDAGVNWYSEVKFQEMIGNPITGVKIPASQNTTALYGAAMTKGAPNATAAKEWLNFLKTKTSLKIFERYGFKAPKNNFKNTY